MEMFYIECSTFNVFLYGKYFELTEIDQIKDFECFDVFDGFAQKYDLASWLQKKDYYRFIIFERWFKLNF